MPRQRTRTTSSGKPTDSECMILSVLWAQGPATVREVFDLFDEDDNGAISRDEVAIVIQSLLGGLLSFCYSYCYEF